MPACKRCSTELAPGALECASCHALVHSDQLDRVAARSRAFEANGDLQGAHEQWQVALQLLPPDSEQAKWIQNHLRELEAAINAPGGPSTARKWAKRLGPLGPLAILLAKFKTLSVFLLKFKFLFTFATSIFIYWRFWGWKFGVGFAVLILVHEMGHYIDIKRRGLPAEMPVFLPGLGAYVRWQAMGVSLETRAAVSLAGPLAGWIGSAVCALVWWKTGGGIWAALARAGAWLNVLNLVPVFILDGGSAIRALSKIERLVLIAGAAVLAWTLKENIFYIVAAGATWRLFTKDAPDHASPATTGYFLIVLTLLGLTMWVMPGQGFGSK
ncbi:MAG TPA: site-2 protease family protein [Candidatus Angelobacter sp.]|nr:site-2 protease family protein [Candidatus Angelobacter sp.]